LTNNAPKSIVEPRNGGHPGNVGINIIIRDVPRSSDAITSPVRPHDLSGLTRHGHAGVMNLTDRIGHAPIYRAACACKGWSVSSSRLEPVRNSNVVRDSGFRRRNSRQGGAAQLAPSLATAAAPAFWTTAPAARGHPAIGPRAREQADRQVGFRTDP